jgi:hypothetical protein
MGLFDNILQQDGAPAPQAEPQKPAGLFGAILSGQAAPAAPAAPVAPASFDDRFKEDPAQARSALRPGLQQQGVAMGGPSANEALALGVARGRLYGFADEAAAGVNAGYDALTGQAPDGIGASYDRHLEHGRQRLRDAETAYPGRTMLGEAGGAMLAGNPLRIGSVALQSALQGGVAGAGEGEGVADRVTKGLIGAATGGVIGKGFETVTRSGAALVRHGLNTIQGLVRPQAAADRQIAGALAEDIRNGSSSLTPQAHAEATAAGQPVAVIDQGGRATQQLGRAAADVSPDARAALSNGLTDPRAAAQQGRVEGFLNGMFGTEVRDTAARHEQLRNEARAMLGPQYQHAYNAGDRDIWDETLSAIVNTSLGQSALRNAITRSADHDIANGFAPLNPRVTLDDAQRIQFGRGGMPSYPNLQLWDYTKRELDRMAQGPNGDPLARRLAQRLRDHLDTHVPEYGAARSLAESAFGARDALEAGQQLVSSKHSNDVARRAVARMPDSEQALFAEGFAGRLANQVREVGQNRNLVIDRIFNTPASRERIEIALGPERARQLETFMRAEHAMELSREAIRGGSHTAGMQYGRDTIFTGIGGLAGSRLYDGDFDPRDPGAMFGALFGLGVAGAHRRVAAEVGRRLASNDPELLQRAVQTVARSRILQARLRAVEGQLAASVRPSATAAAGTLSDRLLAGTGRASGDPQQEPQR